MGFLKGQFQSLQGLRQQINSERDYKLALSWVHACLIIHSLVSCMEDFELEADFRQWVADGLHGHPGSAEDDEVEGFSSVSWGGSIVGESEAQCKHRHIQEALFDEVYN